VLFLERIVELLVNDISVRSLWCLDGGWGREERDWHIVDGLWLVETYASGLVIGHAVRAMVAVDGGVPAGRLGPEFLVRVINIEDAGLERLQLVLDGLIPAMAGVLLD
jgi:hypothetical protein